MSVMPDGLTSGKTSRPERKFTNLRASANERRIERLRRVIWTWFQDRVILPGFRPFMEVCDPVSVPNRAKLDLLPRIESGSLPDQILGFVEAHRYWLFAAVFALYVLGFNGQWRIERDSALYLTIGRNLAEGQGYTYQGQRQQLAFPGLPLLFAATARLFHGNSITA